MQSLRFGAAIVTVALALGLSSNEARAVGADAGSTISNTATVDYTVGTVTTTASSNTVNVTVAEILNVAVGAPAAATPVAPGQAAQRLRFRVENTGNGQESFLLTLTSVVTGDDFDPVAAAPSIYLDNGDGVFGAGDVPYVPGTNDPLLNEDGFVYVFVAHNIPSAVTDGQDGFVTLTAAARTGTGPAGTSCCQGPLVASGNTQRSSWGSDAYVPPPWTIKIPGRDLSPRSFFIARSSRQAGLPSR